MREPKNQMLGTMEPPLMQLSVNQNVIIYLMFSQALYLSKELHKRPSEFSSRQE